MSSLREMPTCGVPVETESPVSRGLCVACDPLPEMPLRGPRGPCPKNKLTRRQWEILDYIKAFVAARGFPPTLREIGRRFGIRSTNGVSAHLWAIEKKGFISREYAKGRGALSRGIKVLPDKERG